ncbi:hypothetical protein WMKKAML_00040 [Enterococcus phage vB_OCPT_PG9]|nr:hypothetical protein WMKKAML_00040 [Enterococcus phage vB_OCPT_PG9]
MLTKDFIEAVEKLGYRVDNKWPHKLYVETAEEDPDIVVSISKRKLVPLFWRECTLTPASDAAALVKLVEEYENTPLEEREEAGEGLSIEDLNYELVEEYILRKVSPLGLARIMEKMLERHGYKDLQFNINYQGTTQSTIPKPY